MVQCDKDNLSLANTICYHTDVQNSDYFFVYNETLANEINQLNLHEGSGSMALGIGSARIENLFTKANKVKRYERKKRICVMYALSLMYGEANRSNWTDTQTYRMQREIVRSFIDFREVDFIVKGLSRSDNAYNPLPNFIKDLNSPNIKYFDRGRFSEILNQADIFIFDFYSTAMAEALTTDKTTILFNDHVRPLPAGKEVLMDRIHLVNNSNELEDLLQRISDIVQDKKNLNDSFLKQYLIPYFGRGGAALAAVNYILERIKHGQK